MLRRAVLDILGLARQDVQTKTHKAFTTVSWPGIKRDAAEYGNPQRTPKEREQATGRPKATTQAACRAGRKGDTRDPAMGTTYNRRKDRSQSRPRKATPEMQTRDGRTTGTTTGTELNDPAESAERGDLRWTDSGTNIQTAPVKSSTQGWREMAQPNKGDKQTHGPERTRRNARAS